MKDRIKEIRKALGLTQEKFSERIGIKRNTIANYETGRNEPIDAVVSLICREFNINEEWLRTGDGNMLTFTDPDNKFAYLSGKLTLDEDPFKKALLTAMMEMSDDEWDVVKRIILKAVGSK